MIDLPERLLESCIAHRLVLFFGSGATTESHNVMPHSFYEDVSNELGRSDGPPILGW